MVNGYAYIYKGNRRKHLRTHKMSNRRSIITTGLKLFRISKLSTEPALSTVAVKPKITAFKTPSNNGKTHLLYRWCLGEGIDITTKPTEGFNIEKVQCGGLLLLVWDVSDSARRRQFYDGTEVLVYVMDSSERPSLENVQKDIQSILKERDLYNTPVLIVATKQDIEGCMSVEDIRSQLQLNSEPQHRFCVVGTSITEWKSVHGALQTLCDLILDRSPR